MIDVRLLFISVLTLFCFMIPGFLLRKLKVVGDYFARGLSVLTLYVAQVALLLHGFILEFKKSVFLGVCEVFVLALLTHLVFYFLAKMLFKKAPEKLRRVLRFAVVFSNAGYMGIPVISSVFGEKYVIYATVYIVWFNVFAFSLGRLIYTDDKSFISLKKIIINPAVIPIIIGLIIYVTGFGGVIQGTLAGTGPISTVTKILYEVLTVLKNMVAPASMMVIGARIADVKFKGILRDKYLYYFLFVRLLAFPFIIWLILTSFFHLGLISAEVISVVVVLSSTPAAALTTIFAELYKGDSPYAGKLVAISTLCSVVTMPIVALLLKI